MTDGRRRARRRRAPARAGKLDPLLLLGALRAAQETPQDLAALARAERLVPASVRDIPVGMQSLAAQMSSAGARRLAEHDLVSVLIDTRGTDGIVRRIEGWDGQCTPLTERIVAARVPRVRLGELARLRQVSFVEASTRLELLSDLAHVSSGLVRNRRRTVSETGRGVLVGVVDSGIDAAHPAFRRENATRIVDYLDQIGGTRYSSAQIDAGAAAASPDTVGHGTHVAGIAAGNGGGSPDAMFAGVAPEADLAIVKTTMESADIATGVAHVFDVATQRDQPCVVNLSLGGHFGGHDGSSVIERTIDQLSGPGRLVAVAAGNEGSTALHAGVDLPRGRTAPARWVADLEIIPRLLALGGAQQMLGLLAVQVWHQREDALQVRLRGPTGELFAAPEGGEVEVDRQVFLVQASHQVAAYSGDHVTTFVIVAVPENELLTGWSIIVEEAQLGDAPVGAIHAWILQRPMGRFTSGAARSHLVGMPGTAYSAITVASYATRREWDSRDETSIPPDYTAINLEDISFFSSPGPTREQDNKPEIAAPGHFVVAPLSADALEGEIPSFLRVRGIPYAALRGTSMATPYVTGTLALLLERDPRIDWAEAKRRLIKSTRQDQFTTPCWNPRWGYGKLDVERLLTIEPSA